MFVYVHVSASTYRDRLREELLQCLILCHEVLLDLNVLCHSRLQEGSLQVLLLHYHLVGSQATCLR